MKITEIYQQYKIMPQQAEHQFMVAAVAKLICQYFNSPRPPLLKRGGEDSTGDRKNIIAACLLHDMGNIVKFNFDPDTLANLPEKLYKNVSIPYWEGVKREFLQRYGNGSHNVTRQIVAELNVSARVKELVDCVGFSQAADNLAGKDLSKKICAYSDMRVAPWGVSSLEERMADLRVRYKNHPEGATEREIFENSLREIERQIFTQCGIKPSQITQAAVDKEVIGLREFEV